MSERENELKDCECDGCMKYGYQAHGLTWQMDEFLAEKYRLYGQITRLGEAQVQLAYLWNQTGSCPCGARVESPDTHPHVVGCATDEALKQQARMTDRGKMFARYNT